MLDREAIAKVEGGILTVRSLDGAIERTFDAGRFDSIEDLAVDPDGRRIAVIAVDRGALPADKHRVGPQSLWVANVDDTGWKRLIARDASEPVWFQDGGRLAVHGGTGPRVIDLESGAMTKARVSPSAYGPARISLSPSERLLALLKVRHGNDMPSIWDLGGSKPTHLPTNASSYGWWDDETLLCEPLANEPRLVDVTTGRWKRFAKLADILGGAQPVAGGRLDGLVPDPTWDVTKAPRCQYRHLAVIGDRVFVALTASEPSPPYYRTIGSGVYSFDRGLGDARQHVWLDGSGIRSFIPFRQGRVIWLYASRGAIPDQHLMAWAGVDVADVSTGFQPVNPRGLPGDLQPIWDPRRPSVNEVRPAAPRASM